MADAIDPPLPEQAARLREAREARGFANAKSAAQFFGWNYYSYSQHERGERGLTRAAERYAAALRVSAGWLLTGEGARDSNRVPIHGRVGAGAIVTMEADEAEIAAGRYAEMPNAADCWAFVVEGDSMRPRFYAGEIVVFERRPQPFRNLLGQYCLVREHDNADNFVKILRAGRRADRWRLESHNADPMEDVQLLVAYPWVATLRPRDGRITVAEAMRAPRSRSRRPAPEAPDG